MPDYYQYNVDFKKLSDKEIVAYVPVRPRNFSLHKNLQMGTGARTHAHTHTHTPTQRFWDVKNDYHRHALRLKKSGNIILLFHLPSCNARE
jgi:hypothetical protein